MSAEDYDRAAAHFLLVQSFEEEIEDGELLAIANFWTGRCRRKAGQYDEALRYTERGENLALAQGYHQMAAIMQATRSWLAFQKGRLDEALAILRLRRRLSQPHGRFPQPRQHPVGIRPDCAPAGAIRARGGVLRARHRGIPHGRRRAIATRAHAAEPGFRAAGCWRSRRTRSSTGWPPRGAPAGRARRGARRCPRAARAHRRHSGAEPRATSKRRWRSICGHGNRHGIAGVHINRGYLCLDAGDLERAAVEAAEAFAHGHEKCDYIVMARARTLQCIVENAAIEEQVGDPAAPPGSRRDVRARCGGVRRPHAESPDAGARPRLAGDLVRRRAGARPGSARGRAASRPWRCCSPTPPDGNTSGTIWRRLKARVLQTRPVDPLLRAWSAGVVENKSFQQMTEEFARIVIPKVWEREGRKVSRVAEKLSISPKKVRRILQSVGVK